jgi:deoxyribose-phosphate aldolase
MAADERRLLQDHLESLISTEFSSIANTSANPGPESGALAALSSPSKLAGLIDHTLLSASATPADVVALTEAAAKHGCATVCVNSAYIPLVARTLGGAARPVPIAVVGFPLGAGLTAAKAFEAREAIRAGAREIDMVQHGTRVRSRLSCCPLSTC